MESRLTNALVIPTINIYFDLESRSRIASFTLPPCQTKVLIQPLISFGGFFRNCGGNFSYPILLINWPYINILVRGILFLLVFS